MALCDYDATTQRARTPRRATARDTTRTMSEASFRSRASNPRSGSGGGARATALAAVEPVESESYGLREVDTRTRGERARDHAVRFVTDKVRNAPQRADDVGAVQGGAFTSVSGRTERLVSTGAKISSPLSRRMR